MAKKSLLGGGADYVVQVPEAKWTRGAAAGLTRA